MLNLLFTDYAIDNFFKRALILFLARYYLIKNGNQVDFTYRNWFMFLLL